MDDINKLSLSLKVKVEITKIDSSYVSARLICADGSCSKRLTKCQLYCFLLEHIRCFARY